MTLEAGFRLGLFEVIGPLGAGGMGEVYRARDARLGREVAIKVLPEAFAADPGRLARFEREARLLAALNHPGIAAIHELQEFQGVRVLVLELVEGKTLAQRVDRGRLPMREALEIARQIAEALESAHEKGIVHRDLKPSNIKLTPAGKVKLLDFGLAKALESEASAEMSRNPTETASASRAGTVLGTAPYMSPEQARGEGVDKRTDVWAFGCVLYEMLTGRRAFAGATTSDTIVSVLTTEPDWTALPRGTGSTVLTLLRRCLTRDLAHRLHDVGDARIEIEESLAGSGPEVGVKPRARLGLCVLVAGVLMVGAAAAGWYWPKASAPPPNFTQLTFRHGTVSNARFAPDGQTVVYTAAWDGGPNQLYSTRIGSNQSRALGIEGTLFSISRNGELAVRVGRLVNEEVPGTLARVSLSGGTPREVLNDVSLAEWDAQGQDLAVVRLVSGKERLDYPIGRVLYEPSGHINSMRFLPTGQIAVFESEWVKAAPDALSLIDIQGRRKVLSDRWQQSLTIGGWCERTQEIWFAAARTSGEDYPLQAVDLSGHVRLVTRTLGDFLLHDLDPQGRVLVNRGVMGIAAMALVPGETRERDVSALEWSSVAAVSADGRTLLLLEMSAEAEMGAVYVKRTDGSPAVRLGAGQPTDLSPDGRWALARPASGQFDRLLMLPTGAGEPRELRAPSIPVLWNAVFASKERLVVTGGRDAKHLRVFAWDLASGAPQPLSSEDEWGAIVASIDGERIAAKGTRSGLVTIPTKGGDPTPVPGREPADDPRCFSPDGRWLFVQRMESWPPRVDRIDVRTGERHLWKEIPAASLTGAAGYANVVLTPDGRGYAYSYVHALGKLYIAEGLQ